MSRSRSAADAVGTAVTAEVTDITAAAPAAASFFSKLLWVFIVYHPLCRSSSKKAAKQIFMQYNYIKKI